MKVLQKLLLIHWHYFNHELIEFGQLNFLTGKNASGKSTIIDAMQLILLGDTSGNFFNKAASGRGNRTLKGYLMGELGDDEDSGFRYLRKGRFTSYIAMEFYDTNKKKYFTAGCCFDIYAENDIQRLFFLYDGEMHKDGFLQGSTPMSIPLLRAFLKENYSGRFETTDIGRDFKLKLYGKLGGLRDRFSGLLKKAVSFNPNVDIKQFISDFVCDTQQAVDVSHMQENIRSYKRLEEESIILQEKISLLEKIVTEHGNFMTHKINEQIYSYLIDRAETDIKKNGLVIAQAKESELLGLIAELEKKISDEDIQLKNFREKRDNLTIQLSTDNAFQTIEKIDREIQEKESQIGTIKKEYEKAVSIFASNLSNWANYCDEVLAEIESNEINILEATLSSRINDILIESQAFLDKSKPLLVLDTDTLQSSGESALDAYISDANSLKNHTIELISRLNEEKNHLTKKNEELVTEKESLEKGMYSFPKDAIDLKETLRSRLRILAGKEVDVSIVAEASEISNDTWRNAIEGYLHTQKFYIIVPMEYFDEALKVYNMIKSQQTIYSTGLVDIAKIKIKQPIVNQGSLAEEIEASNGDVKVFLDYVLGNVQKCYSLDELRKTSISITQDGMLYQNYVARAMNPKRWSKPAIGQGAIKKRLETVKNEIISLNQQIKIHERVNSIFKNISKLNILSTSEADNVISTAANMSLIANIETDLIELKKSREEIDTSSIDSLKSSLKLLETNISEREQLLRNYSEDLGRNEQQANILKEETIPGIIRDIKKMEDNIKFKYNDEQIFEKAHLRYHKEITFRETAEKIAAAFPREYSKSQNAKTNAWSEVLRLRITYNEQYKMGFDIHNEENDVYDNAWMELADNKLPEYLTKIADARTKAFEQFQEDFLSRLQNNINNAKRQIDDLNSALRGSLFGEDTFRFRIIPKTEYKRYYDMIVDDMLLQGGGYNLLSEQFNSKYKDEIADLFAIITNENRLGGAQNSSEYERRVHEFTDYRTYLDFDLEVTGKDGFSQRLSKTIGKKSGGETQTPFYISVLASFVQLYRVGRDKTYNTSRLIIFDEAFSKMDGERIVKSIELLRKFEFQVILSAPPDKVGDIAALVDKNLIVLRSGKQICVKSFDPKQLEGHLYD